MIKHPEQNPHLYIIRLIRILRSVPLAIILAVIVLGMTAHDWLTMVAEWGWLVVTILLREVIAVLDLIPRLFRWILRTLIWISGWCDRVRVITEKIEAAYNEA